MPDVTDAGPTIADQLAAVGRRFHARGWVLGTSGNFSAVVSHDPLRLAITASALDKGALEAAHILHVGEDGQVLSGTGRPSAETLLHVEIARRRGACAVLHTHSVWGTTLSDAHAADGGLHIDGYEMLKGLDGVCTHEHREWVPIVENDQDMARLSGAVGDVLARYPAAHGVLLRRHGLYAWGKSLADAVRHVEILEFLFETIGRTTTYSQLSGRERHHGIAQSS